jgi:hypothetical protein
MAPRCLETCVRAAIMLAAAACGTDAVGVQACRQVEEARCQEAPGCGVALEPPYHTSGTDTSECIRFYNDQCLHGVASGADPGPTAVNACVAAIHSASTIEGHCSIVIDPSTSGACVWLGVSSPAVDASSDSADTGSSDSGATE